MKMNNLKVTIFNKLEQQVRQLNSFKYCYLTLIVLFAHKWFQVLLFNTSNPNQHYLFAHS